MQDNVTFISRLQDNERKVLLSTYLVNLRQGQGKWKCFKMVEVSGAYDYTMHKRI